jgi:hypothetical protein
MKWTPLSVVPVLVIVLGGCSEAPASEGSSGAGATVTAGPLASTASASALASAEAYELVAVEMKWTPGTAYTAPLRLQDFSVSTGSQFPNRPETLVNEALKQAGWALLPDQLPNGQSTTGWVVFKVDPQGAPKMTLDYTRPRSQIVGSDTVFAGQVFSAPLVG